MSDSFHHLRDEEDSLDQFQSDLIGSTLSAVRKKRHRRAAWRSSAAVVAVAILGVMVFDREEPMPVMPESGPDQLAVVAPQGPIVTRTRSEASLKRLTPVAADGQVRVSITRTSTDSDLIHISSDQELFAFLEGQRFIMVSEGAAPASLMLLD